ncbi:unnamed protein product [Cunninghamella blakesleeana]
MKFLFGTKTWLLALVVLFFIGNLAFWSYHPRPSSQQSNQYTNPPFHEPQPGVVDKRPPPQNLPPPPPPPPHEHADLINKGIEEARLYDVNYPPMNESPNQPKTYIPETHNDVKFDLETIAPTGDKTTLRYNGDQRTIGFSKDDQTWQLGVINTKPDVFITSDNNFGNIRGHYAREHRIYTLMKWILRIHRRDPERKTPLLMIDAGSNHGLFSMVAGVSGAHAIAFEPQTHLRSIINFGIRVNQISDRVRVLPFAVLDEYRELGMANFEFGDGGIGALDYNSANSAIKTQTIRLDAIPSYDSLYTFNQGKHLQKTLMYPEEIGTEYAASVKKGVEDQKKGLNTQNVVPERLTLRDPIHFLKIDVEGFELQALESATKLFENNLVEHAVLEFGPPNRWDVTFQENIPLEEKRAKSTAQCKRVLRQMIEKYGFDIYVLPSIGWQNTVTFLAEHGVDFSKKASSVGGGNKLVHKLYAYDFDGKGLEGDEFERELDAKNQLITEYIPLPPTLLDDYVDRLEQIGEVYIWLVKRSSPLAKTVLYKGTL